MHIFFVLLFVRFSLLYKLFFSLSFCRFFLLYLMKLRSHTRKNCFAAAETTAGESLRLRVTVDSLYAQNADGSLVKQRNSRVRRLIRWKRHRGVKRNTLDLHVLYSESSLSVHYSTSTCFLALFGFDLIGKVLCCNLQLLRNSKKENILV